MSFLSYLGIYLVEVVFYSLVIVASIEILIAMWRIRGPLLRIKLRFLGLLLPLVFPLLFSAVYPARNGFYFREQIAILDLGSLLGLGAVITGWYVAALVLVAGTLVFIFRDGIPVIKSRFSGSLPMPRLEKGRFPRLDAVLAGLPVGTDGLPKEILISPEEIPVIYRSGNEKLVISESIIDLLDDEELRVIIGHEMAHGSRAVRQTIRFLLVLRWLHFYNPLAHLIFRSIIKDIEKLCDDTAVRLGGKRLPLVSGLIKVFRLSVNGTPDAGKHENRSPGRNRLEDIAGRRLVKERMRRLMADSETNDANYQNFRLGVTAVMLAALLFFIV